MAKQHFLQGALVLSAAGLFSRFLGAAYRIPLARMIGGEGMGLYQMAYPIYAFVLAISTAGVPVAISLLIAEKRAKGDLRNSRRIFQVALVMLAAAGIVFFWALYLSSNFLARYVMSDSRAVLSIRAIAPAVFFTAVVSAFRGYFQGQQQMLPTALSQVAEQSVRVVSVLAGAYLLFPRGVEYAAAAAAFGAVSGGFAGLVLLVILFVRNNKGTKGLKAFSNNGSSERIRVLTAQILKIALPFSLGGLVMPLSQMADAIIVPMRLQAAGWSMPASTSMFGYLSGMAGTLINIPSIIFVALAVSLVPALSEARAVGDEAVLGRRVGQALRVALLLGLPSAAGLAVLAGPVGVLLFNAPEVGGPLLFLAPAVVSLGLYQTSAAGLQGLGKIYLPVKNLLLGMLVKVLLNYYLAAQPQLNVKGAAMATFVGFSVAFIFNLLDLRKSVSINFAWGKGLAKPLAITALMALAVNWTYNWLLVIIGANRAAAAAVVAGVLLYGFLLVVSGCLDSDDLRLLLKGKRD